jgi:hypothetical protein
VKRKIATLAVLFHCWSAPEEEGKTNRTYIIEPLCFVNVTDGRAIFYAAPVGEAPWYSSHPGFITYHCCSVAAMLDRPLILFRARC